MSRCQGMCFFGTRSEKKPRLLLKVRKDTPALHDHPPPYYRYMIYATRIPSKSRKIDRDRFQAKKWQNKMRKSGQKNVAKKCGNHENMEFSMLK